MFSLKHAAFIPFHEENGNARASNFLPQKPSVGSEGNDQLYASGMYNVVPPR